jgi:hypothetical protein
MAKEMEDIKTVDGDGGGLEAVLLHGCLLQVQPLSRWKPSAGALSASAGPVSPR